MKLLRIMIFCLLQNLFFLSFAQTDNLKFTHLNTAEGLSQSSVFAIIKDYKGFMWFATDEGLNKYDGYNFTIYKHDPDVPGSLNNNSLHALLEDASHNLWVLSSSGLDKFDRTKETFIHYNNGNAATLFKGIYQDAKKRIWIGASNGFYLFDPLAGTFKLFKNDVNDSNSLSNNYVFGITGDNYGDLWIGTKDGLNRFNPATGRFIHYKNDPRNNKSLGWGYIKAVYNDSKGNIWAGTQGSGIALFNRGDNSFVNFKHDEHHKNSICHNDILSFTEDQKGRLWIGTENGGISIFDPAKNIFATYQNNETDASSLSGNSVYSLYKDDIGNIWAGTWSGGINFLPLAGDKFRHYQKIPDNSNSLGSNLVLSICDGPGNSIWLGTDGGGLSCFDPVTHIFTNYKHAKNGSNSLHNDYVLSIALYLPGVLALGFHHGGLDLFDVHKQRFTHFPLLSLSATSVTLSSVNMLYKDKQQKLWMGIWDNPGVFLFDTKASEFTNLFPSSRIEKSINNRNIYVMYETISGHLWTGGDKGLSVFDRETKRFSYYSNNANDVHSLSNNVVYSIIEDKEHNLWVGTAAGLNFFNTKTKSFTVYTEKDGLPNNTIWSIEQDYHGNLWLSTNKGLSRFNPVTKMFRNFSVSDGLQNTTFKVRASYQSPGGEMFFGGVNGFNAFYPDSIKDNNFIPPVYLTDFQVFNKPVYIGEKSPLKQSINEVKEIRLSYDQSVFTLGFAALNFTHPEQNLYAYKLEGFDKDWSYVRNKRTATYTNLNPGTYTFKVRGSNNDGIWNEKGTSVKIIVTPPFWLTWWFIGLMALVVLSSLAAFYRLRINIIKNWGRQLEVQVAERTQQLAHSIKQEKEARQEAEGARYQTDRANKELERKNKEVEQFAYIASHDLQEPLRTTSSFIELLQKQYKGQFDERADKYFSYVLDASNRMKALIKSLLDYSRPTGKSKQEKVDCALILANVIADLYVAIQEAKAVISYDSLPVINGYPNEIKQLFQNLLTNAIKFRKKDTHPQVIISVQQTGNDWVFKFRDNGIGIEEQNQEKIFNIFQRLHSRAEYEGSGIGLSHCKKIVALHNGKIWVNSTPGKGCEFCFTLSAGQVETVYENNVEHAIHYNTIA